jgi:hypothetical protein
MTLFQIHPLSWFFHQLQSTSSKLKTILGILDLNNWSFDTFELVALMKIWEIWRDFSTAGVFMYSNRGPPVKCKQASFPLNNLRSASSQPSTMYFCLRWKMWWIAHLFIVWLTTVYSTKSNLLCSRNEWLIFHFMGWISKNTLENWNAALLTVYFFVMNKW